MEMDQKVEEVQSHNQSHHRSEQATAIQRRTENLLRINADDYSTKHLVIFWALLILLIIAIALLTLALPPTLMTVYGRDTVYGTSLQDCPNVVGFDPQGNVYCKPISSTNPTAGLLLRDMSTKNQFFFVYVTFVIENKANALLYINTTQIQLEFYELSQRSGPGGVEFYKSEKIQNETSNFTLNPSTAQRIYQQNGYSVKGYRQYFGYQKYVDEKDALILLTFKSWPLTNVKYFYLQISTVTPGFTLFSILIRYVLFAISLGTLITYYVKYRLIPEQLRTLEQRMILYLSFFTVMFNDPFYAATILTPNGFTAFLSVTFIVNFLTFLLGFWMVFMDRIYYGSGEKYQNTIDKKKIVYFVIFYVCVFTLQFQIALLRFNDAPLIFSDNFQSGGIVAFEIISLIVFIVGMLYIGFRFVQNIRNFFDKIWRNQMFLVFSIIFMAVILVMFILDGFSVYEYTGNRILILFGFMNMYTIYLQYMYSINKQVQNRLQKERFIGRGDFNRNQVETIASHFGNQDIMVDLDSEIGDQMIDRSDANKPYRMGEYSKNINQRVQSRQEIQQQDDTENYLKMNKQVDNHQVFSVDD